MTTDSGVDLAPVEANRCPVCERAARARRTVHDHAMLRCGRCALWFHPRPDIDLGAFYDEEYFQGGREHGAGYHDYLGEGDWYSYRVYEEVRDRLRQLHPERGRLLDVGCAAGFFVEAAARDGWHAEGIDIGDYVVDAGRRRGLTLHAGTLEDAGFAPESFDVVTSFHTLEHVLDPVGTLRELRRIVKSGGTLLVEVPNARSIGHLVRREGWSQIKPPEHLNYFGPRAARRALEMTGWNVTRIETNYQPEIAAHVHGQRQPGRARFLRRAATLASKAGTVRLIEMLRLGANLRFFATRR